MKSELEAAGIQNAKTERMPWGIYWHTDTGGFREGHFDKDGKAFEWPFDSETRTSGKPVALKVPNAALTGAEGVRVEGTVMQHNDERKCDV